MNAMRHIRVSVFGLTQAEFAKLADVGQATVSRWENGVSPSLEEMQAIRSAAFARGINWDDRLFFEPPPIAAGAAEEAA
jgi:transcriptional regulator with XRE-family HTH domain